jgi:uncharacterized protein with NRDE domain
MCVIAFIPHPRAPGWLILANRDEYHARPTLAMQARLSGTVLAGTDLVAGGTWLAIHASKPRIAAVTNIRRLPQSPDGRRSRGELPLAFAASTDSPDAFVADLDQRRDAYLPFNLLLFDAGRLICWSSTTGATVSGDRTALVVGNAEAGIDWPKTARLRQLASRLSATASAQDMFEILADRTQPPDMDPAGHRNRHRARTSACADLHS